MKTFAGTPLSPSVARILEIRWQETEVPALDNTSAVTRFPLRKMVVRTFGKKTPLKPAVVKVFDADRDKVRRLNDEKKLFGCDSLAMASHAFTFFKVKSTETLPRGYLFLDVKGNVLARLTMDVARDKFHRFLSRTFSTHYEGKLKAYLGRVSRVLDTLEKAEDDVAREANDANKKALKEANRAAKTVLIPPVKKKTKNV